MRKPTVLLVCILCGFCLSFATPVAAASDEQEVLQIAENWTRAINSGDFEAFSALYWNSPKTTSFAPPANMAFLTQGYEAVVNNVKWFFELPAEAFSRSHHNPNVTMIDNGVAILTLYEVFTFNPPVVEMQTVYQCRQTLVVQKIGGKWLIVHVHGSFFPTE